MTDLAVAVMAASATRIKAHARTVTRVLVALALVAGITVGWYAHAPRTHVITRIIPVTACALTVEDDDIGWYDGVRTHDWMRRCDAATWKRLHIQPSIAP